MTGHWIDGLARLAAGTQTAHEAPARDDLGEPTLSRNDALKAASAFALAGMLGGFRPDGAWGRGQTGCAARCDAAHAQFQREEFTGCHKRALAIDRFLPHLAPTVHLGCAASWGVAALISPLKCGNESLTHYSDGSCQYDGSPEKVRREFERTRKAPDRKTRKRKPPQSGRLDPGSCPGILAGQTCCGSKSGPTVCSKLGCDPGGGCCARAKC